MGCSRCGSDLRLVAIGMAGALALAGCANVDWGMPSLEVGDDVVLGCPDPVGPNEPARTLTDGGAVVALAEALTLCDDELISHPEDREFQRRLVLQETLEKIDRKRAHDARRGQIGAKFETDWDAPPRG